MPPTAAFAELEALRSAKQRELAQPVSPTVPAVALQQFLVLLQAKKFEKAKALAFKSARMRAPRRHARVRCPIDSSRVCDTRPIGSLDGRAR